jgi:hypothetical protein
MTDIEEQNRGESGSPSHRSGDTAAMAGVMRDADGRSVRGSILNSPKNHQFNNAATRLSDMSIMSSINLINNQTPQMHGHQQEYYSGKFNHLQDLLRYDHDRHLDVSMTSMYSTPRN